MKKIFLLLPVATLLGGCSTQIKETKSGSDSTAIVSTPARAIEGNQSNDVSAAAVSPHPSGLIVKSVLQKIEVLIPGSFKLMDDEMIAVKYPLKQGTTFQVYTDEDAAINIAFEHTLTKATPQQLPALKKVFEQQFNQPGIDFRKSEIQKINGRDFIVMEMITPAVDTDVYNLMFVTSSEGRMLMGTFNCTIDRLRKWKPLAEQILNSVKVQG